MCEICDKNISNEKYEKLRKCLFKIKTRVKLFLKWLLTLIKGHLCLRKRHLDYQEGQMDVESLPNSKLFLILLVQIENKCFFRNNGTLSKVFDPRTLYLSEIGPER